MPLWYSQVLKIKFSESSKFTCFLTFSQIVEAMENHFSVDVELMDHFPRQGLSLVPD